MLPNFFSLVGSGRPLEIASYVLVRCVYRSVVSERSEYRRCFAGLMTYFMG